MDTNRLLTPTDRNSPNSSRLYCRSSPGLVEVFRGALHIDGVGATVWLPRSGVPPISLQRGTILLSSRAPGSRGGSPGWLGSPKEPPRASLDSKEPPEMVLGISNGYTIWIYGYPSQVVNIRIPQPSDSSQRTTLIFGIRKIPKYSRC